LSSKSEQLAWRREKVIELKVRGMNHSQIARELQVSRTCIVDDVNWLRNRARVNIREYVTKQLPEQYIVCLATLDEIIKQSYAMLHTAEDNEDRRASLQLLKETHFQKMELLSDAMTIDETLSYIRKEQQEQIEQKIIEEIDTNDNKH
jgi:hypothetical protein